MLRGTISSRKPSPARAGGKVDSASESQALTGPLGCMVQALELEVAAIKARGRQHRVDLREGALVREAEGSWVYGFQVAPELALRDDSPIRLRVGENSCDGVVLSVADGQLLVSVSADLGLEVARAQLVVDDSFLIERLRAALASSPSDKKFASERALRGAGLAAGASVEVPIDPAVSAGLDKSQFKALARALGSEVTFLWGPPGTGKTFTLARIVEAFYRQGKTVLLVSNTNIAVDTALECVVERLRNEDALRDGAVQRYGQLVKPDLVASDPSRFVIADDLVSDRGADLVARRGEIRGSLAALEPSTKACEKALATASEAHDALEKWQAYLDAAETRAQSAEGQFAVAGTRAQAARQSRLAAHARLVEAENAGVLKRVLRGLNVESLKADLDQATRAVAAADACVTKAQQARDAEQANVDKGKAGLHQASAGAAQAGDPSELRGQLAGMRAESAQLEEEASAIDRKLDGLREEVRKSCKVLAATVYQTWLKTPAARNFDVVVIDEASMLALPMVAWAAGRATQHVVVAGDPRQLPSIVTSDDPLALEWLAKDAFRHAQAFAPLARVQLNIQRRMRRPICGVVNDLFYTDSPLLTDPGATNRRAPSDLPFGNELAYVDTSSLAPWVGIKPGGFSRYNITHGMVIQALLRQISRSCSGWRVGLITPYAAQVKLLDSLTCRLKPDFAQLEAATVHRFQGSECDLVVLDVPDSVGARPSRFVQATSRDEDGARLLNVALSRARDSVVLVANFNYLRSTLPKGAVYLDALTLFEQRGVALSTDDLVPDYDLSPGPVDSLWVPRIAFDDSTTAAFSEEGFYSAFSRDLDSAARSIVIFSPFMTERGTGRWADVLHHKLREGCKIRVVTRPPKGHGDIGAQSVATLITALRSMGVAVDIREDMHEKVAVIDDAIVWHGSLNILSHRDTSESMLRIPSADFAAQLGELLAATPHHREKAAGPPATAENPVCSKCGGATIRKTGGSGVLFTCSVCDGNSSAGPRTPQVSKASDGTKLSSGRAQRQPDSCDTKVAYGVCPSCGEQLIERPGRYGRFVGCTGYPACKYTRNV